jgi:ParB family chromosome partitioning protein
MTNSSKGNDNKTLGRGLAALFGEVGTYIEEKIPSLKEPHHADINSLKPGRMQPRQDFNDEKLEALTNSIKQKGVLQPLLVRKLNENEFEIVAGERRWRAAQSAGLSGLPVIEISCNDQEALEIGLIENLQRDDLNPLEEAESFLRLMEEHKKTHDEIAFAISKSRSYVTNMLRLNNLPPAVKELIRKGKLSAGHARSIATTHNIEEIAEKIVQEKLSVREAENLARSHRKANTFNQPTVDPDIQMITQKIGEKLGMKTKLQFTRNGGALTFYFQSYEQLDDLIGYLSI